MMSHKLNIMTMNDYLYYFIERVNRPPFDTKLSQIKQKILHNCFQLNEKIQQINGENFFQQLTKINNLEAEIWILFEISELEGNIRLSEEEILQMAHLDCHTYFKERCGMNLNDLTPPSIHFLT